MRCDVVVVGAGISGLACARALEERGISTVLLDKGRRAGGRVSSYERPPRVFDYGAQYFTARDESFARRVADWQSAGVVAEWRPRLRTFGKERPSGAAQPTRWVGTPTMAALPLHLAQSLRVETRRRVAGIEYGARGWSLYDDAASVIAEAHALVMSAPAPQAAALLPLDATASHMLSSVVMRPTWAVQVAFAQSLETTFDAAFVNEGPLKWVALDNSKPGRPRELETWVLHATPEWSMRHLELEPGPASELLLLAFQTLLGFRVPAPDLVRAHRWRFARPAAPLGKACWVDRERRLGLCGDWFVGGRIEGAYLSGTDLGQKMAEVVTD